MNEEQRKERRMHDPRYLSGLFNSDSVKGVLVAGAFSAALWVGHTFLTAQKTPVEDILAQHTQQIQALEQTAKATNETVNDLKITAARTEGKIDTLSAKIDDDRHAADDAARAARSANIAAVAAAAQAAAKSK